MRIATFNCENLFRRIKVLNLREERKSTDALDKIKNLQTLVDKESYAGDVKQKIFDLSSELAEFIDFRIDGGNFGSWKKDKESGVTGFLVNKSCAGRESWIGQIMFRYEPFSDTQQKNTARVMKDASADVLCTAELKAWILSTNSIARS